jgi:hypothetical protein
MKNRATYPVIPDAGELQLFAVGKAQTKFAPGKIIQRIE